MIIHIVDPSAESQVVAELVGSVETHEETTEATTWIDELLAGLTKRKTYARFITAAGHREIVRYGCSRLEELIGVIGMWTPGSHNTKIWIVPVFVPGPIVSDQSSIQPRPPGFIRGIVRNQIIGSLSIPVVIRSSPGQEGIGMFIDIQLCEIGAAPSTVFVLEFR